MVLFIVLGVAVLAGGLALGITARLRAAEPLRVALCGLGAKEVRAFRALAAMGAENGQGVVELVELSGAQGVGEALAARPPFDLIVGMSGEAFAYNASRFQALDAQGVRVIPSAPRRSGQDGRRQFAVPLLLDHYEMAYRADQAASANFDELLTRARALKSPDLWPLFVPGADDEALVLFASALVEARLGSEAWSLLHKALRKAAADSALGPELFALPLEQGDKARTLGALLDDVARWQLEGLLHRDWLKMNLQSMQAFMKADVTVFAFMKLSQHRDMDLKVISKYLSQTFPAARAGTARSLTAPLVMAGIDERAPHAERAREFLALSLSPEGQRKLSWSSGLAPAHANAEAQDVQATEARFWIAGAKSALPSLASAASADPAFEAGFAQAIRDYIKDALSRL